VCFNWKPDNRCADSGDRLDADVDLFVAGSTDRGPLETETVEDDFGKEACAGERGIATDKEVTDVKRV
jgi:hypothetical protein